MQNVTPLHPNENEDNANLLEPARLNYYKWSVLGWERWDRITKPLLIET